MLPVPLYRLQPRSTAGSGVDKSGDLGPCCWCWSRTSITLKASGECKGDGGAGRGAVLVLPAAGVPAALRHLPRCGAARDPARARGVCSARCTPSRTGRGCPRERSRERPQAVCRGQLALAGGVACGGAGPVFSRGRARRRGGGGGARGRGRAPDVGRRQPRGPRVCRRQGVDVARPSGGQHRQGQHKAIG